VKGLGLWSAQLFLIFSLGRPDVVAAGDLGIRRAVQTAYDLDAMPTPGQVQQRAEAWRPHRTAASLLLWRSVATIPA
jgi:DNA-3-methyladenine glycosylase II